LAIILGHKTQIEVDEAMVRMDYNIIEVLLCYEFTTFLSNEIRNNLFNINKGYFRHSSYMWWLIFHQNMQILVDGGLSVLLATISIALSLIDMRVLVLMKVHGSYYDFMKKCFAPFIKILTWRNAHRLHQTIWEEI